MKKLKLLFMTLIGCILIFSIPKNSAKALENRIPISLDDTWVSDGVDKLTEDAHFYQFTIPSSGTITYTFQSYQYLGQFQLLSDDLVNTYSSLTCRGTDTNPESKSANTILEQGNLCIKDIFWCHNK